mmetsp:Transcript_12733/g.33677  ORF Transcript_12733/g.33677 Transcript_12733/m.33677 type:complete len:329 (+) Transcript_12733:190-1176(+)
MTATHAVIQREEFVRLGLKCDSVVMEEAGQLLEIETLIPMLMQKSSTTLERVVLIGDHNQLPPVVKNAALAKYSSMEQSLFSRLIRLGNPVIELNMQGRARPDIAALYQWRYSSLGNLPSCSGFDVPNAGFEHSFQLIDTGDICQESQPMPFFYQNLAEAEYIAAVYQYMRLLGYPSEKITVLTTYRGQKDLLRDVISARIAWNPSLRMPSKITTVDKYQGQQNDYVLLSLVRTKNIGHIRDVRRLVVALSRARLGLYVFCKVAVFQNCLEIAPAFVQLTTRPTELSLVEGEKYGTTRTPQQRSKAVKKINNPAEMADVVSNMATSRR